jgi:hypothetical protein
MILFFISRLFQPKESRQGLHEKFPGIWKMIVLTYKPHFVKRQGNIHEDY